MDVAREIEIELYFAVKSSYIVSFQFTNDMRRTLLLWYTATGKELQSKAKNNYERSEGWRSCGQLLGEQFGGT
jgi:hypothetical protein